MRRLPPSNTAERRRSVLVPFGDLLALESLNRTATTPVRKALLALEWAVRTALGLESRRSVAGPLERRRSLSIVSRRGTTPNLSERW